MGTLSVVATPLGNLQDITLRALETLKSADVICCEDTRRTKQLLAHFNITTPVISFHQHSSLTRVTDIVERLASGQHVALVTDAGTPGVADPAGVLVQAALTTLGDDVAIVPIPGPAAVTALVSVSGWPSDSFLFLGFLPHKKGRQTRLKEIAASEHPVVIYESPHRIHKLLGELGEVGLGERQLVVGRELTKKFETIYRGTAASIAEQLTGVAGKGEFVIFISTH